MKQRIIIVSNRLPVSVGERAGAVTLERSNGGLATALSSLLDRDEYDARWVGWPGTTAALPRWKLLKAGWDKRLLPVALSPDILHRYYEQLSNGLLWPLLHGLRATIAYDPADWQAYEAANRAFAQKLLRTLRPTDVIWIHDYHLMLLPGMLRQAGVMNRIGFFLHVPFARPDCLTQLPGYQALMTSLAQTDVLGFQTERDASAFRAGLAAAGGTMRPDSIVQAFPIGVDFAAYQQAAGKPSVRQLMETISRQRSDKRVILSVSRLDYTKGVPEQLLAYEQLLATVPDPAKFLYKLIVAPSREDVAGYQELKARIEHEVARINARFGTASYIPIDYAYHNFGFDELVAWYQLSDVLLVTPLIDGMNLVVKEYIAARHNDQGMVVLSNTAGAARQLSGALQAAPHDVGAIAVALRQALTMPQAERALRWMLLSNNVQYEDVLWWLDNFLAALQSKTQAVLMSQHVHHPRMHVSGRLEALRLLRLVHNR